MPSDYVHFFKMGNADLALLQNLYTKMKNHVCPPLTHAHKLLTLAWAFALLLAGWCLPVSVFSQVVNSSWRLDVCEKTLPINTNAYGVQSCADNCNRVYYYFYLVNSSNENPMQPTPVTFNFTSLTITGTISVTGTNTPSLSEVNLPESVNCSPTDIGLNNPGIANCPLLSYDPQSNGFAYQISATNLMQPVISYPVFGRRPLFVLAVDVYPGETVQPTGLNGSFTRTNANGSNPVVFNATLTTCTDSDHLNKMITAPTVECTSTVGIPLFRVGEAKDAPVTGFPNRKRMPVWVDAQNSSFSWNETDFLLSLTPGAMQMFSAPAIEGNLIAASAVRTYPSGSGFRIYTHQNGVVNIQNGAISPDNNNILFYIVFDGPQLESDCLDVTVNFADDGRLDGGDFSCCKPKKGIAMTASWASTTCVASHCPEVTLRVSHNPTTSSINCDNKLYFDLFVTSSDNTTDLNEVRCVLNVKKNGNFTLNPTLTYSPYCTTGTCLTVSNISAEYLRIEYSVFGLTNLILHANSAYSTIKLATIALNITSDNGCIDAITFADAVVKKAGTTTLPCLSSTQSEFVENQSADDICGVGHMLEISAETEVGISLENWSYYVDYKNAQNNGSFPASCLYSGSSGGPTVSRCVCSLANPAVQDVVLKNTTNYLNGVSTYDLVLITRHVLSLEPLKGFNMLAADADMNASVTTFDIVALRRLILGIDQTLPNANSWRFIDKDLKASIQPSSNPFPLVGAMINYPAIPSPNKFALEEFDEFSFPTTALDSKVEFVGFKVGDVNGNSIAGLASSEDRAAEMLALGSRAVAGRVGEMLELPVFSLGAQSLSGWQLALKFDTSLLEIENLRWPSVITVGAAQDRGWHLPAPGELRVLWFSGQGAANVAPGTPLFFVQARLRRDSGGKQLFFQVAPEDHRIPSEAYTAGGKRFGLSMEASKTSLLSVPTASETGTEPSYRLVVYPNPAGSNFRLEIEASVAVAGRLEIHDLLGRAIVSRSLDLVAGMNTVTSAQLPVLPAGQYVISLYTPAGVKTQRLVRQ